MLKKIDHIAMVVKDLEKAKNFFLDLGFRVNKQGYMEGEWINRIMNLPNVKADYLSLSLNDGQTNLELVKFYSPEGGKDDKISMANQVGYRHVALEVENIEEIFKRLKAKGVNFFSGVETHHIDDPNSPVKLKKVCYFLGPEGIILEINEYE